MTTSEFPMVGVRRLRAVEGHKLWVQFSDGSEGVRDFTDILAEGGPMVEPLRSPDYFARVFVESGVPTWPNGFDIDAINLYMELRDAGALTRGGGVERGSAAFAQRGSRGSGSIPSKSLGYRANILTVRHYRN